MAQWHPYELFISDGSIIVGDGRGVVSRLARFVRYPLAFILDPLAFILAPLVFVHCPLAVRYPFAGAAVVPVYDAGQRGFLPFEHLCQTGDGLSHAPAFGTVFPHLVCEPKILLDDPLIATATGAASRFFHSAVMGIGEASFKVVD
jgi:hypothetical protein